MVIGFTVGIGDTIADESTLRTIVQTIRTAKEQVTGLFRQVHPSHPSNCLLRYR